MRPPRIQQWGERTPRLALAHLTQPEPHLLLLSLCASALSLSLAGGFQP